MSDRLPFGRRWHGQKYVGTLETEPQLKWRCTKCGRVWKTHTALMPRMLGCPECGGKDVAAVAEGDT